MPTIEAEFEVYCTCGNGLCANTKTLPQRGRYMQAIEVEPCEKCTERAKDEGYEKGYAEGQSDG